MNTLFVDLVEFRISFKVIVCYDKGRGVPQDCAEAVNWFRKVAEQGHLAVPESLSPSLLAD